MTKTRQMRFNAQKFDLNEPVRICRSCGCKTGSSGLCGFCKIIETELLDVEPIQPKIIQTKLEVE